MDPGARLLQESQYAIYAGVCATLVQTIAQLTEATNENKIRLGISLGAFLVNFVAALWAFSFTGDIEHDSWKVIIFQIVFISTGIMSPYAALSVLLPKWFTWYGFAIICTLITLYKSYNMLKSTFIWFYEKVVDAMNYVIETLSRLLWEENASTDASLAPAPPPALPDV